MVFGLVSVVALLSSLPARGAPANVDTSPPVIKHTALTRHDGVGPLLVRASIVDDSPLFEPTLLVRLVGTIGFVRVPLVIGGDDLFAAEVPAALLAGDVEYFIEAFDENGNGPSRVGKETAPMVIKRDVSVTNVAAVGTGTGTDTTTTVTTVATSAEDDGAGLVVAGAVIGTVALLGAAAGIAYAVYTLRPPAPDTVRLNVSGPAPIAGAP